MNMLKCLFASFLMLVAIPAFSQQPVPRVVMTAPFGPNDYPTFQGDYSRQYVLQQAQAMANPTSGPPIQWVSGDIIRLNYPDGSYQFFGVNVAPDGSISVTQGSGINLQAQGGPSGGSCRSSSTRLDGIQGYWVTGWSCVNGSCAPTTVEFVRREFESAIYSEQPPCYA